MNYRDTTKGVTAGFVASVAMALMTILVHEAKNHHTLADIVFFRSLVMAVVTLPFAIPHLSLLRRAANGGLWLRSLLGAVAMILYLQTLQMKHIGLANSMAILTQILVPLGGWLFLKETLNSTQIIGLLTIGSAVLYLQFGPIGQPDLIFLTLAMGAAILAGISFIMLRVIAGRYPASLIVLTLATVTIALTPIMDLNISSAMFRSPYLWGISASALVMQIFITVSYRKLPAAQALVINETFIVFAGIISVACNLTPFVIGEFAAYLVILFGVSLTQKKTRA